MKRSTIGMSLTAVMLLAFGAGAHEPAPPSKPAQHQARQHQPAGHSMAGHSAGSMELHRVMMQGWKMPMPMTGDVDKDFASMMTHHHQQAIRMAEVLLRHGRSAELKELARKMQASQREEIRKLAPHTK